MTPKYRSFNAALTARALAEQGGANPHLVEYSAITIARILGGEEHIALARDMLTRPEQAHMLASVPVAMHAAFRRPVARPKSVVKVAMKRAVDRINARVDNSLER